MQYLLSFLIFLPLAGLVVLLAIPRRHQHTYKYIVLGITIIQLALGLTLYAGYQKGDDAPAGVNVENGFQFVEKRNWIDLDLGSLGRLSADYFLAVDGINVTLVLLAVLVMVVAVISSWRVTKNLKGYFSLLLLLNGSIIGTFVALDFLLFYLFFEFMLLPMYFLIGIWGGPRREYASIKFFLYTLLGSLLILVVLIGLYLSVIDPSATAVELGMAQNEFEVTSEMIREVQDHLAKGEIASQSLVRTFNMVAMMEVSNYIPGAFLHHLHEYTVMGVSARLLAFLLLFVGFAIKIPVAPLHTWLPDAHVEASTAISVILAAVLLKIGGYGLIRTAYSIFPEGGIHFAWLLGVFGVISIIYGAFNALASKDLKKLIAYSSVSHMGFVLLGLASLTPEGVSGALYQMFSHGVISAMLFLIAGVIYDRTHDRMIENYSGLVAKMPYFTGLVLISFFASLGLPGFSAFIAEVLVLLGAFGSAEANGLLPQWMAVLATSGLLLSAAYYLWTIQRMFFGKYFVRNPEYEDLLVDLHPREYFMLIPLAVLTFLFGIFPQLFLEMVNQSVGQFVGFVTEVGVSSLNIVLKP